MVAESVARDEGVVAIEQRVEERVELDHLAMRLRHSSSDSEGALSRHGHARVQKAGLAEPGPPFDDDDRADPGSDLVEPGADGGELVAAPRRGDPRVPPTIGSSRRECTSGLPGHPGHESPGRLGWTGFLRQ